ncbi:DNA topoisomerase I [Candidatus Bathyarchaeota archaeon]|nr:DNA topoisomerase I [Candidatus Bathyarchaeota archaeon]
MGLRMGKGVLIIAEKPDAAQRIAEALDDRGKPKKSMRRGIPYFLASRKGESLIVVPALGHLYTVCQAKGGRDDYPIFEIDWAPRYLAERGASQTKLWIETISELSKEADTFISACDFDIEGSLIGYNILKYACGEKDKEAKRMRFSTLTERELVKAYENASPQLDFPLIEAGRARHEVDFIYGVNLTRALTSAVAKESGRYFTISTGRVQGPTLHFVVEREKEILSFVPTPYWKIDAMVKVSGRSLEALYEKDRIETFGEAQEVVEKCGGKIGLIKDVRTRRIAQAPPTPFNIGDLQAEAYRLFGFTPLRTLGIAEALYLSALISYPRTSSQKLPATIDSRGILEALAQMPDYKALAQQLLSKERILPHEGEKEDSAHPAIYPTGKAPDRELNPSEKKLYDLIVKRFMATFAEESLRESLRVEIENSGYKFFLQGSRILEEGWLRFYRPYVKGEEKILPPLKVGQEVLFIKVEALEKFTEPPPRFNPSSLLRLMEDWQIGTKATRAEIIDTLYKRNYVRDERMAATELGFDVDEVLGKFSPAIISVDMTRELESRMDAIEKGLETREKVLAEAIDRIKPVLEELKARERELGEQLSLIVRKVLQQQRSVGACPVCGTGTLFILRSRRTGKRFVGCSNFFKGLCKASFPLPQRGTIKPTGDACQGCGWPTLGVKALGRRPWILCLNPSCPKKAGGEDR